MKRIARGLLFAGLTVALGPGLAMAQCEGGSSVSGYYLPNGTYVPGGCASTNPLTPGQLYPSGAQSGTTTNPAAGASRLPGQVQPSGLLPVNSSDVGPAPSFVQSAPGSSGPQGAGPSNGPGVNIGNNGAAGLPSNLGNQSSGTVNNNAGSMGQPMNTAGGSNAQPGTGLLPGQAGGAGAGSLAPGSQVPQQAGPSGDPALTINRGVPSADVFPGSVVPSGIQPNNVGGAAANVPSATVAIQPEAESATTLEGEILLEQERRTVLPRSDELDGPMFVDDAPVSNVSPSHGPQAGTQPPLPPGRGGPTIIGEERGGGITVVTP